MVYGRCLHACGCSRSVCFSSYFLLSMIFYKFYFLLVHGEYALWFILTLFEIVLELSTRLECISLGILCPAVGKYIVHQDESLSQDQKIWNWNWDTEKCIYIEFILRLHHILLFTISDHIGNKRGRLMHFLCTFLLCHSMYHAIIIYVQLLHISP